MYRSKTVIAVITSYDNQLTANISILIQLPLSSRVSPIAVSHCVSLSAPLARGTHSVGANKCRPLIMPLILQEKNNTLAKLAYYSSRLTLAKHLAAARCDYE